MLMIRAGRFACAARGAIRECTFNAHLDLPTLLWTRGREFPLLALGDRLKCPACGSRRVSVMFVPPATPNRQRERSEGNHDEILPRLSVAPRRIRGSVAAISPLPT